MGNEVTQTTRQVGLLNKGGGLNTDEWVKREKEANPKVIVKDFPTHVEFHIEEKKK